MTNEYSMPLKEFFLIVKLIKKKLESFEKTLLIEKVEMIDKLIQKAVIEMDKYLVSSNRTMWKLMINIRS